MIRILLASFLLLLLVQTVDAKQKQVNASWYEKGKITASGQPFNPNGFTAAHRYYPFGTRLRVTNPKTGKVIVVRINDRGPFIKGRELDLSKGSAIALGFFHSGTAKLLIEVLGNFRKVRR
jgi:rare lipoprotein A